MAPLLDQSHKWKGTNREVFTIYEETHVRTKFDEVFRIDRGRSFYFNRGCNFYFRPPPIVVSANEIWPLDSGSVKLQAVKALAVGDYGLPIYKELFDRPTDLPTLRRIAVEKLCQRPDDMMRLVYGREGVDLTQGLE